jgi:hypothetical protein
MARSLSGVFQCWIHRVADRDSWTHPSVGQYPYPSELPSTSTSPQTLLSAPNITHLPDNLGHPSSYLPITAGGHMSPTSVISQYAQTTHTHHVDYGAPDRTRLLRPIEEHPYTAAGPSFPDVPPAQLGAPAPWQNLYPLQNQPTTMIQNGTFIGGDVNNTVQNGESGMWLCALMKLFC